mmetsp:Transcript_82450/g.241990  ORF Transcript_82450/g.241990 Transcript_82450/m.241990 type:complete len:100 (+) Transcript_82450:87-386(+)
MRRQKSMLQPGQQVRECHGGAAQLLLPLGRKTLGIKDIGQKAALPGPSLLHRATPTKALSMTAGDPPSLQPACGGLLALSGAAWAQAGQSPEVSGSSAP